MWNAVSTKGKLHSNPTKLGLPLVCMFMSIHESLVMKFQIQCEGPRAFPKYHAIKRLVVWCCVTPVFYANQWLAESTPAVCFEREEHELFMVFQLYICIYFYEYSVSFMNVNHCGLEMFFFLVVSRDRWFTYCFSDNKLM